MINRLRQLSQSPERHLPTTEPKEQEATDPVLRLYPDGRQTLLGPKGSRIVQLSETLVGVLRPDGSAIVVALGPGERVVSVSLLETGRIPHLSKSLAQEQPAY